MYYEKEWEIGESIHSVQINTHDWALPFRIVHFKTNPNLFEGLVGKLLVFQVSFLCFSYRIEKWWMGKDDEDLQQMS